MSVDIESNILYEMGMKSLEQGQYDVAVKHFEKSMELKKRAITSLRLYECYTHLKKPAEARESIEMAYMMNSGNEKIAVQYAALLVNNKEMKKAKAILQKIMTAFPNSAQARKLWDLFED